MTNTRINHTGHDHPNTTAARTACRKAMKTATPEVAPEPRNVVAMAGGKVHAPNTFVDGIYPLCRTGSMSSRNTKYRVTTAPVSCRNCR